MAHVARKSVNTELKQADISQAKSEDVKVERRNRMELPLIDDIHRHPGMPSIEYDKPVHIREQCAYLTKISTILLPQLEMPIAELMEYENFRLSLLDTCMQLIVKSQNANSDPPRTNLNTSLLCFGSLRSGIALRGSDMDLLLKLTSEEADVTMELDFPRQLEKALLLKGYGARLITNTRVPIIRMCTEPSKTLYQSLWREREKWETIESEIQRLRSISLDLGTSLTQLQYSDARMIGRFHMAIKDGWFNGHDKKIIREFEECYREARGNDNDPALRAARSVLRKLPRIIDRYEEPGEHRLLDIPSSGVGVRCDINFTGELARHNTQLIRCYARCDERVRQMILFVKSWTRNRDINSPCNGTLCSYGYVLMVLHFALNVAKPPLCPNLQQELGTLRGGAEEVPRECEGHNIQFWRDESQIEIASTQGVLNYNRQEIGSLLRGFFEYYSQAPSSRRAFVWSRDAISIRSDGGLISKHKKGWTGARNEVVHSHNAGQQSQCIRQRYLLAIEDPFEINHNVARSVTHIGICAIRDEFRRAYRLVQHAGMMGDMAIDLMEKSERKELIYSWFHQGLYSASKDNGDHHLRSKSNR